jgi:hypothetical protein
MTRASTREWRRTVVARANRLRDPNFQLKERQWQRAIFTLRQKGSIVPPRPGHTSYPK